MRARRGAPDLDTRLRALAAAADAADGRLEPAAVDAARVVVGRAGARLGLGLESTVVALAGPTGAGKSTLFNALAGEELVTASARRPTTATATAAVWGTVDDALLDWLVVPRRHRREDAGLDGLVLLDLPDFDSVEASHRMEVDRLVPIVDLLVWVTDPQKYADASMHDGYLRPLAPHREAMLLVLNQADRLDARAEAACRADLARLLDVDGLPGVPVLALSARTGEGLPALREAIGARVAAREAALARLAADLRTSADALAVGCDGRAPNRVGRRERERLVEALELAAGVPGLTSAVAAAHRRRGALATGWPFFRWVRRLRPDPLRRLRLQDRGGSGEERTSLPRPAPVQLAQAQAGARDLADGTSEGMAEPWPAVLRRAATSHEEALPERLERAVAGADLGMRRPRWWSAAGALQWVLAAVTAVGVLWLVVLAALGTVQLGDVLPLPEVEGIPLPTLLLGGGALAGLLVGFLARLLVRAGAGRRASVARRAIHARLDEEAGPLVVDPVDAELAARRRICESAATARGPS